MIGARDANSALSSIAPQDIGRPVDPMTDSEDIRLIAVNLELAMRNLLSATALPTDIVLTADLRTCRVMAMPTEDGEVQVRVFGL